MGFLLKSGFWFAVVLMFLPVGTNSMQKQRDMAQDGARSLIATAQTASRFCLDQPELCESAARSTKLASEVVTLAAQEISAHADSLETNQAMSAE